MNRDLNLLTARQIRTMLEQKKIPYDKNLIEKKILLNLYSNKLNRVLEKEKRVRINNRPDDLIKKDRKNDKKSNKEKEKRLPDTLKLYKRFKMKVNLRKKHTKLNSLSRPYLSRKRLSNLSETIDSFNHNKKIKNLLIWNVKFIQKLI